MAFKPEYAVEGGFVDYALLDRSKPRVFVEAKRKGAISADGEDQLFRYAAHQGVPLLVLTDGNVWALYSAWLKAAQRASLLCGRTGAR